MKHVIPLTVILFSIMFFACEKEINISEFRDEFGNYRPELKIEGLLQVDKPENSIVRIIKTSTITDNELYNDIDDDGEIHDFSEILKQVQDTSATVTVTDLHSGAAFDFRYTDIADSTLHYDEEEERDFDDEPVYVAYGGYKPVTGNFEIIPYHDYQIDIYSRDFNKTITGTTTAYPPAVFIDTLFAFQDSTVRMHIADRKEIFWKSDSDVTSYYITYEEILAINGNVWASEWLYSRPAIRDNDLTDIYRNVSVGWDIIFGVASPRILRLTVEALSPEYSRYIFSSLPLKDPQRTNLRDADGNPVMGCFGAIAGTRIYIVIEE